TGLREDYSQEAATYLLDEAENSFVLGRASILREYSNYDPYRDFFSYFSKNGEILVDETTDFQPFAAWLSWRMHQIEGQSDVIWLIGEGGESPLFKIQL
ncbi:MAG: hypothetical protein AAF696_23020, partial [Bacteroidota bacterium]